MQDDKLSNELKNNRLVELSHILPNQQRTKNLYKYRIKRSHQLDIKILNLFLKR